MKCRSGYDASSVPPSQEGLGGHFANKGEGVNFRYFVHTYFKDGPYKLQI